MDEMDRFRPKNLKDETRHAYKGNRNPSPREFAKEGYATLSMADVGATYGNTPERPDQIAEDVEFNRRWIRRL
jgi:hypothetical protein